MTTAHTPGSQVASVKLENTGLAALTGANLYFKVNYEKNIPPNIVLAYHPAGYYKFYEWLRLTLATHKGEYFTAHDPDAFVAIKKAPAFYD